MCMPGQNVKDENAPDNSKTIQTPYERSKRITSFRI